MPTREPPEPPPPAQDAERIHREVDRLGAAARDRSLLRALLHHTPHGVLLCDAEGAVILKNRVAERIWPEGGACWEHRRAFRADGSPYAAEDLPIARCLRSREAVEHEVMEVEGRDGRRIVLGSCVPIVGPDGELEVLSVFTDITEWKRAEREAEALFELTSAINAATSLPDVFEVALDAITRLLRVDRASVLLADADGIMRFRAWRGLSGAYRQAVEGHSPWATSDSSPRTLVIPDVLDADALAAFLPVFEAEHVRAMAFVPLVHDRRLVGKFMVYSAAPRAFTEREVQLAEAVAGQIAQALSRAQALDRERTARVARDAQAARMRALAEASRIFAEAAAARTDECRFANVLASRVLHLLGSTCVVWALRPDGTREVLVHARADEAPAEAGAPVVLTRQPARSGLSGLALDADGPVVVNDPDRLLELVPTEQRELAASQGLTSAMAAPMRAGGEALGTVAVGRTADAPPFDDDDAQLLQELGDRAGLALAVIQANAHTDAARAAAEEAARRKDEFLAVLGHELRNPLAPIVTALHLMRRKGEASTVREREILERQVVHVSRLVDDLLDVSRITSGKLVLKREPTGVHDAVARAIEVASPILEERAHALDVEVPRELRVLADPERLAQVVGNLLTNAAKYTPPKGRVSIRAERRGDEVRIGVRDNGRGIPPEALPRLFEPFFQVDRTVAHGQGGLGLGLALVRSLTELHGGHVEVASAGRGQGSEFTVTFPPAEAAAVTPAAEPVPSGPDRTRSRRVLVVDDNPDAAIVLAEVLRELGHEVRVAHDGAEALGIAEEFDYDVALVDIGLPAMDGFELAGHLRGLRRGRLVAVTGYGQESDRARSRAAGFEQHLTKPVSIDRIVAAVEGPPGGQ